MKKYKAIAYFVATIPFLLITFGDKLFPLSSECKAEWCDLGDFIFLVKSVTLTPAIIFFILGLLSFFQKDK